MSLVAVLKGKLVAYAASRTRVNEHCIGKQNEDLSKNILAFRGFV